MTFDRTSWWWQRGRPMAIVALGMLLSGWMTTPLRNTAWQEVRSRQPALAMKDLGDATGQGMILGLFGGFRQILADFVWLDGYTAWEKKDRAGAETAVYLATTLDPSTLMFWDDGSGRIGYDIPVWRTRSELKEPARNAPEAEKQQYEAARMKIVHEQDARAIELLDRGLTFLPENPKLYFDKMLIYDNPYRENDLSKALSFYHQAAEAPGAPYFYGRLYGEALLRAGRTQDAFDYLKKFYFKLPNDDPAAAKDIVWKRLIDIENDLKMPDAQRLPASDAPPGWTPEMTEAMTKEAEASSTK